jgi:molecular chaperone GrpE
MNQDAPEQGGTDDELEAGVTAAQSDAAVAEEQSELDALRDEVAEAQDKLLRLAAELDNVRKRATRDIENARRYGLERLAQALLPVRDSLEAGLAAGENADAEALLEGKQATLRLLDSALEQVGIAELDPEGQPFDPAHHEAMTMQPSATAEPNTVLTVIQKGYAIHDRLLRPARVVVASASEPEETD